jgi:hypothetical protein
MADWIERTPRIVWGDDLDKVLDFGQPFDNPHAYDLPGEGSEQARTPAGAVSAWLRPRMYFLEGEARNVPGFRSSASGQPATGWFDADGFAAFLRWAQDGNAFYLYPDNRNLVELPWMTGDGDADGVADGFIEVITGAANITGEDVVMDGARQKCFFTGSTGGGQGNIGVRTTVYGIVEGDVISASVSLEVTGLLNSARAQFILEFIDAAGVVVGSTFTTTVTANQADTRITNLNRTAPATAVGVRITCRANAQAVAGGVINTWWHSLLVRR